MGDDNRKQHGGGIRRVGRKDRKRKLDSPGPLFQPEDDVEPVPEQPVEASPINTPEQPVDTPVSTPEQSVDIPVNVPEQVVDVPVRAPEDSPPAESTPPKDRFPPVAPALADDTPPAAAEPPAGTPEPKQGFAWRLNLLTAFFIIATIFLCAYYSIIWNDPFSPLNPFAPPTPFVVVTTTPESGEQFAVPTEGTEFVFSTPTLISPTAPTVSLYPFALAETGVVYIPNANERACNWASIAGAVTGLQGEPLSGYGVRVMGEDLNERVFSGSALTYGPGGFELPLGGAPVEAVFTVQLFNLTGTPVSDEFTVATRADCNQNVVVVNFIQGREF